MNKKKSIMILSMLLLIILLIFYSYKINNPLHSSDAAFYSKIISIISNQGYPPTHIKSIPTDYGDFPIFYPQIFFVLMSLIEIILGNLYIIKIVSYILFFLFSYLIFKNIFKIGFIPSSLISFFLCINYYISHSFFFHQKQEFILLTFLAALIYFMLDYRSNNSNIYIIIILTTFLITIKQTAYLFFITTMIFILSIRKINLARRVAFILFILFLVSPVLLQMFGNTGTFLYNDRSPYLFEITEKNLGSIFGVERIYTDDRFMNFSKQTTTFENREQSVYKNLSKVLLGYDLSEDINKALLLFIVVISIIFFIKNKDKWIVLVFLYLSLFSYLQIAIYQYFLFLQLIVSIIIVGSFDFSYFRKSLSKKFRIIIVLIIISIIFLFIFKANLIDFTNKKEIVYERINIYKTPLGDGDLLSPRMYELSLYQNKKVYWYNHYGNWDLFNILSDYNSEDLKEYMEERNIKYIFIPKWHILKTPPEKTWQGSISYETVEDIRSDKYFDMYNETDLVLIFKTSEKKLLKNETN